MKLEIKTEDKQIMELPGKFIDQSFFIQDILKYTRVSEPVSLKINYECTVLIREYLEINDRKTPRNLNSKYSSLTEKEIKYFRGLSQKEMSKLMKAANYLEMPLILENACRFIAISLEDNEEEFSEFLGVPSADKQEAREYEEVYGWMSSDSTE